MRKRELIRELQRLHKNNTNISIFPLRKEIREAAIKDFERLAAIGDLVPEIIEKLRS